MDTGNSNQQSREPRQVLYKTHGTCSQFIDVALDDEGRISHCYFHGGCDGNLQGIWRLVKGQKIDDVINRLDGIRCGDKPTSCPDQLCRALEQLQGKR